MDYNDLAKKWVNKGNNDLRAGKYILSMPNPPADAVCFHGQQAVNCWNNPKIHFKQIEIELISC